MSDDFIKMINDIDFSYGFIYECANLINNLYDHYNYDHLAIKLYRNFVLSIINITKDKRIKEYNEHVKDSKYINRHCSYLMHICFERYFELSKDEYLEIKKFIDSNIDIIESTLAHMNDYFDSCKKCCNHCYCSCYYYHKKKLYVFFLKIDIKNFMKKL